MRSSCLSSPHVLRAWVREMLLVVCREFGIVVTYWTVGSVPGGMAVGSGF